jgi:hypothetical protein
MKRFFLSTSCAIGATVPLLGQEAEIRGNANRLSLAVRAGLNFTAEFRNQTQSIPGLPIAGINHSYDDGFVNVDSSGAGSGGTWNWGYQNASQVSGGSLDFHSEQVSTVPLHVEQESDDVQPGLELSYERVIGKFFLGGRWGLEGAISYNSLDIEDSRSASGTVTHILDSYNLNGAVAPTPPYNGSFDGPGPVLSATPVRTATTEPAFTSIRQELSGFAVGIRIGPFFEWAFAKRFAVTLSGGLLLAPTKIDYEFSETLSIAGGPSITTRGDSDATDLLYGNYVAAALRYDFTRQWGVFAGVQYQTLNELEQTVKRRTARLEQDGNVVGVAGVSWRF